MGSIKRIWGVIDVDRRLRIAALTIALTALAVVAAGTELRSHSPGSAALTALTVTAGGTTQTLFPTFSSTVHHYVVPVADGVAQITIEARPDGDGTVAYEEADGTALPDADVDTLGQQVDLSTDGKRINVEVTHDDAGEVTKETYGVLVIREGPAVQDTIVLMALYDSTDGDGWTNNTNWGSTVPINGWAQVNADGNGRVTYLALWSNNLRGTLPAELGNLDQLTELPLQDNHLTGSIPDLGRLSQLELLRMGNNQLSGEIPASLSNLTKLRYLELWENQLTGPIPDLRRLTALEFLDLHSNQLSGNIPSMSGLTELEEMRLQENRLSGPIPDLSGLTSLARLYLNQNQLTGEIPASLDSLTELVNLYLQQNQLTGEIPASLGNFAKLTQLFLWGNQLTGEIPASLGNLTTLRQLSLSRNQLTGEIPASLGNLIEMLYLYLNDNQLSGEIPASLGDLSKLSYLYLWGNQLSGEIPASLGNLTALQYLVISQNELSGEIPDSLRNLSNLYYLYLNDNQLSGEIPASLGDLINLSYLYLYDNQLSGEIPASLDNLANLQQLILNQNQLSGMIPDLRSLTNLTHLTFANNQLDGAIPDWVGRLTKLQQLALGGNQLTGEIPPALGGLTSLTELSLGNNQLSGEIPPALGDLTNLKIARFADNTDADGNPSLTGCVPHGLRYLLAAEEFAPDVPAHDFIGVDANGDRDTDDPDDIPGLNLPFCMLSALDFRDVTLNPSFASGTAAYTGEVDNTVAATTVTATLNDANDTVTIMKARDRYTSGDAVPLDVGSNVITITVTPADARLLKQTYTVQVFREGSVESDRAALVALYNSAGGSGWTDKTNWDSTEPLSTWFGVTLLGNGRVVELSLPGNNVRGTLPAELGSLTSLNVLNLSDNRLSGTIPDWLGDLRLQNLYLNGNQLSGCVPDGSRADLINHDFMAVDANGDGDTADAGDTPGLPFCTLSSLTLSGDVTLNPEFTSSTTTYTGSAAHDVEITTVTASLNNPSNTVSIIKGANTYTGGDPVPLDVGSNVIAIEVTRPDDPLTPHTYTVTVTRAANAPPGGGFFPIGPIGPPGPPPDPTPSDVDFEWTVTRDIEALDPGHDSPTGAWSNGTTLWITENGSGGGDAIYAYDLATGERVAEREFALDDRNRAPRGVWSDRVTLWVSDSGHNRLYAHDLESGERLPERDIELDRRNGAARGIWADADGQRLWVLDDHANAIFVYDLASGELLAEYTLDDDNDSPHGLWSDGVTIWVSNHDPRRLFAYRLPAPEGRDEATEEDAPSLERVHDEEFTELSTANNNSPRGLWSDGEVMYVVDEGDDKVYSYNMPDAIDARLASLTLSGIDIGEFSSARTEYDGVAEAVVTETTVEAEALQRRTEVTIDPPDADGDEENGHQVVLEGVEEITVTVMSADGSRERVYRVRLGDPEREAAPEPWAHCLRGDVAAGFSLVVFEGGSVEELITCAESRDIVAFYALHAGVYVSYILEAPDFVNRSFAQLFPDGVPPLTPLVAGSDGPPSADPNAGDGALLPGPECLRGGIAEGFSLVVYAGGSVDELETCARNMDVTALYVLHDGAWISYILIAPEFVNRSFGDLFPDGLPPITPLVARSEKAAGN